MSKCLWCKLPADGCVKHLHENEVKPDVPLNVNIINITSHHWRRAHHTHTHTHTHTHHVCQCIGMAKFVLAGRARLQRQSVEDI